MADQTLSDRQLDHLITTGLVTHFLVLPAAGFAFSIDPKMVSGVDGITFTVVLDDGRVAIGCPAAVPDVIAEIALPIDAASGGFPRPVEPPNAEPKAEDAGLLQEILETLRGMAQTAIPDPDIIAQSLNRIEGQVTTLRMQAGAADAVLSGLDDRLDRMAVVLPPDQISSSDSQAPKQLLSKIEDVRAAIEARLTDIEAGQSELLVGLTAFPGPDNLVLEALSSKVDAAAAGTQEAAQALRGLADGQLETWLTAVPQQLAQMMTSQDRAVDSTDAKLAQINALLTDIANSTDPIPQPIDSIGVSDMLDTLQADQTALRHIADAHSGALDGVRLGVAELMAGQLKQSALSGQRSIRNG